MTRPSPDIVLIDFGMGNLRNVARAFERVGAKARVSRDPEGVLAADRAVLPGVGSTGDAMLVLRQRGLDAAVRERVESGRPYLGICVGMQLLLERAEEGGEDCLGTLSGEVAAFPRSLDLPVPHMGWNRVMPTRPHPVVPEGYFYFVHGYRPTGVAHECVLATTEYGSEFPSAIGRDAFVGVQFHPEKSQHAGLDLIERFCRWSP